MICRKCGKENDPDARFCTRCGTGLSANNVINSRNTHYDKSGYKPDSSNYRYEDQDYSFSGTRKSSVNKWKIPIAIIISLIIFTTGLFIFRVLNESRPNSGNSSKNQVVSDVTEASENRESSDDTQSSDDTEVSDNTDSSDDTQSSDNAFETEQGERDFTADDIRENADEVWEIVTSNDQFDTIYVGYYESEDRSTAGITLYMSKEDSSIEFNYADGKVSRETNKDGSENVLWSGDDAHCVMEKKGSELILEFEGEKYTLSKTSSIERYIKIHDSLVEINKA